MRVVAFALLVLTAFGRRVLDTSRSKANVVSRQAETPSQMHSFAGLLLALENSDGFVMSPASLAGRAGQLARAPLDVSTGLGDRAVVVRAPAAQMANAALGTNVILGSVAGTFLFVGVLLFGIEKAAERSETVEDAKECFECKGERVQPCRSCDGTGNDEDQKFGFVAKNLRDKLETKVMVEDWDSDTGFREMDLSSDMLINYPVREVQYPCPTCEARGVIICTNCEGTGKQPRFMDKYSPEDFMD